MDRCRFTALRVTLNDRMDISSEVTLRGGNGDCITSPIRWHLRQGSFAYIIWVKLDTIHIQQQNQFTRQYMRESPTVTMLLLLAMTAPNCPHSAGIQLGQSLANLRGRTPPAPNNEALSY